MPRRDEYLDPGVQGTDIELAMDERLLKEGWKFNVGCADHACSFFETNLHHSKGEWAGQLLRLEPWQRRWIRRLFGWERPDGTRRYRRSHVWLPRKNGKSTLVAGVCLYALTADAERGAEIYSCATDEAQAHAVFGEARNMADASPILRAMTEIFKKSIWCQKHTARYSVISAKPGSKHGLNVHVAAYDEIHAARDRGLYDVMTSASGARRNPLELVISTAGDNTGSFAYELWEYALKVRDGILEDPEFLPVVYCAEETDDWRDERTWAKANPNFGVSVKIEFLRSQLAKVGNMPGAIAAFKQLYLNIWSQAAQAAIDLNRWKRCARKDLVPAGSTLIPEKLEGKRCWGGLDLSSTNDLTAFALAFPRENEQGIDVLVWQWVPEENVAERAKRHRVDYPKWIALKQLYATPGNVVDYTHIEAFIARVAETVNLQDIGYDPRNATDFVQRLQDDRGLTMVEVLPNYKNLSPATKELERLYLSRHLGHNGNPVLTWQASHVVWRSNATGDIMPDKKKSREKIDGIAALVTAIARVSLGKADVSSFEKRGVIVL